MHGTGRAEKVTLDLTLNGQDYVTNGAPQYIYYPMDNFTLNCSNPDVCNHGAAHAYAKGYRGALSATASGRTCQRWDAQVPHSHQFTPERYADADLVGHSFCRSPGGLRNEKPWCYTSDPAMRWDWCDVGAAPDDLYTFRGLRIESIQPYGGPAAGGTLITLSGRFFLPLGATPTSGALCNFGPSDPDATAEAYPLGGPARRLKAGTGNGTMPWHVPATLINGTHAICTSPPLADATNESFTAVGVELTVNGQLADLTQSGVTFQYYAQELLSARWIYPVAGPKAGGTDVTLYGTGLKPLGHPSPFGGHLGLKCLFGHLPPTEAVVLFEIGAPEVMPALGDDPMVEGDGEPLASAIVCRSPPYSESSAYAAAQAKLASSSPQGGGGDGGATTQRADVEQTWHRLRVEMNAALSQSACTASDGRVGCSADMEAKSLCLEVTLNNDPWQHSKSCVGFTYYDA